MGALVSMVLSSTGWAKYGGWRCLRTKVSGACRRAVRFSEWFGVTQRLLWLDQLFFAIFVSKAKHTGFISGLENGIRVFGATWSRYTKTRRVLRCADLD